ncbi:MAG: YdeI/OmpD-associated family protein [Bacteroidota bacterium]
MKEYKSSQRIKQLEKRKGGYYSLIIPAEIVNQFKNKRATRFICTLDDKLEFRCGLNHLGDGNFFIIVGGPNLKKIGKSLNDPIHFKLTEDPNPLGVEMPEVLQVLLDQDELLKNKFQKLTMGKKRNVIHTISKIKDVDKQVKRAIELIETL